MKNRKLRILVRMMLFFHNLEIDDDEESFQQVQVNDGAGLIELKFFKNESESFSGLFALQNALQQNQTITQATLDKIAIKCDSYDNDDDDYQIEDILQYLIINKISYNDHTADIREFNFQNNKTKATFILYNGLHFITLKRFNDNGNLWVLH